MGHLGPLYVSLIIILLFNNYMRSLNNNMGSLNNYMKSLNNYMKFTRIQRRRRRCMERWRIVCYNMQNYSLSIMDMSNMLTCNNNRLHVFNELWSSTLCSRGGAGKFHIIIKVCKCKTSILKILQSFHPYIIIIYT